MNEWQRLTQQAEHYKNLYPEGTRVICEYMNDNIHPVPSGTRGTVEFVDDLGTIHCRWDNGQGLGLTPNEDKFRKLTDQELLEELEKNQKDTNNDIVSVFYGKDIEINGETKHLYPIGYGEWTWDSYTKEEMIDKKIEYWHTHNTGNSLKEFLGMSDKDYEDLICEDLLYEEPDITEDI